MREPRKMYQNRYQRTFHFGCHLHGSVSGMSRNTIPSSWCVRHTVPNTKCQVSPKTRNLTKLKYFTNLGFPEISGISFPKRYLLGEIGRLVGFIFRSFRFWDPNFPSKPFSTLFICVSWMFFGKTWPKNCILPNGGEFHGDFHPMVDRIR